MSLPISVPVMNVDAFIGQHLQTALDNRFFELHIRDAVHEQPADPVGPFVDGDRMPGAVELGGSREPGGAGADDGDFLSRAGRGRIGTTQPFLEAPVDNGALDRS